MWVHKITEQQGWKSSYQLVDLGREAAAVAHLWVALDCIEGHHTGQCTTPGLEQAGGVAQVVDVGGVIQSMSLNQGSGLQEGPSKCMLAAALSHC